MNAEYFDSRLAGDDDDDANAVVTYTRVPAKRRHGRQPTEAAPRRSAERGPILDASEIRPEGPIAFDHPAGETRRDGARSGWRRYSLVGGSLAVVGGVGILAITFGVTTVLPGSSEVDRASGGPALALTSAAPVGDDVSAAADVREIPITLDVADEPVQPEDAAPIPRPRPDGQVANAAAELPAVKPLSPMDESRSDTEVATDTPVAVPVLAPPESAGTDSLITSIEETLAQIDESASAEVTTPATPAAQLQRAEVPILSPPDEASPPTELAPPAPPTVAMPPADIAPPPAIGGVEPVYDVFPPPIGIQGVGNNSAGPVPPEPVPQAYPQAPHRDPMAWPYPSEAYIYPQNSLGVSEPARPGFLRRTLARASDAVGRVLERN